MVFKKTVVMAAGLLVAGAASAQGYVDVHLGQATADLTSVSGVSLDKTDSTYSLNIGYKFNDLFSVEGGYTKLGEASASNSAAITGSGTMYGRPLTLTNAVIKGTDEVDGYNLGLAMDFPINNAIDISGRAGVFMWDLKSTLALTSGTANYNGTAYAAGSSASVKSSGSDLYWGLGASYKFNKAVRAGVNFTRYDIDGTDVDTWTANLRYSF